MEATSVVDNMKTMSVGERTLKLGGGMVPISEMIPNFRQPRMKNLLDPGLRMSIMETKGLVEPMLIERIDEEDVSKLVEGLKDRYKNDSTVLDFLKTVNPKYLVVDGERRWVNSVRIISENPEAKAYLGRLPCDIITEKLTEKERYIVWISIHKMRREWKAMEKETAAQHLIKLTDPANAAAILGITLRKLQKFIDIYRLAEKMRGGPAKDRAISYARETMNLAKKHRTDEVVSAIVDKVNKELITDAVDIRKVRTIVQSPEAKEEFLARSGTIDSAIGKIEREEISAPEITLSPSKRFGDTITQFRELINSYSWREVQSWKGNSELTTNLDECIKLLQDIKKTIS